MSLENTSGAVDPTGKPAPAELRMTVLAANADAAAKRYTSAKQIS